MGKKIMKIIEILTNLLWVGMLMMWTFTDFITEYNTNDLIMGCACVVIILCGNNK